jgi:hypothetical protein
MYKHIKAIWVLLVLILSWSCNNIDFENYESEIVVDGWIEQGQPARVLLTKSAPYFGEIDSLTLRNYALTHARVKLNDGQKEEILTLTPNTSFFPPYMYVSTEIIGEVGKSYQLTIEADHKTVTANTTIPEPIALTNAYMQKNDNSDSLGVITIEFSDPVEKENFYMAFIKYENDNSRFESSFAPFHDELFNGQDIKFDLQKGFNNASSTSSYDGAFFNINDTIIVKFCTIDSNSFLFWLSFQKEIMNTTNPFAATNSSVKSNITNGLGIWCGYGVNYVTVYPDE